MKKFFMILALLTIVGCTDPRMSYQHIRDRYPNSDIQIGQQDEEWYVKTASNVVVIYDNGMPTNGFLYYRSEREICTLNPRNPKNNE